MHCQNDSEAEMSFSVDVLAKIAIELQTGIGHQDRFQRLISTLRHVLACDASALLRYEDGSLFRWPSTAWRRTCSGGALPLKAIRVWKLSPARVTWCVSRRTAICPTRTTG